MVISMLKIRRPLGRLIFNMGIAIPGKTVFLIETAPWVLLSPGGPHVGTMNLAMWVYQERLSLYWDWTLILIISLSLIIPHSIITHTVHQLQKKKTSYSETHPTVQYHYNTVNFLTNIHKIHPTYHPLGWDMGCFLWVQHLIDILFQFL